MRELITYFQGLTIGLAIGATWGVIGFYPQALTLIGSLAFFILSVVKTYKY